MSKTKDVTRYWSPNVRKLATAYAEAKEIREESLRTIKLRLYKKFDQEYSGWFVIIN